MNYFMKLFLKIHSVILEGTHQVTHRRLLQGISGEIFEGNFDEMFYESLKDSVKQFLKDHLKESLKEILKETLKKSFAKFLKEFQGKLKEFM